MPQAWVAIGAALQLAMVAKARSPRDWLWAAGPLLLFIGAGLSAWTNDGHEEFMRWFPVGFTLIMGAGVVTGTAPPRLDGGALLAITTAFWLNLWQDASALWAPFAGLASLTVLVCAAGVFEPPPPLKLALYVWGVSALSLLGAWRFPHVDLDALARPGREWIGVLAGAWLGAHLSMLVMNVATLFMLLPIKTEQATWEETWARVARSARLLTASYDANPVPVRKGLVIVVAQIALYAVSLTWSSARQYLALQATISLALLASVVFTGPSFTAETLKAAETPGHIPSGRELKEERRRRRAEKGGG